MRGFSKNEKRLFIYHNLRGNNLEETAKRIGVSRQTAWNIHPRMIEIMHEKIEKRNLQLNL